MRISLVGLIAGLIASTSVAQIPMSNYVRTFTSALTRGYFFKAPVDFTVTELQVPDEFNRGEYVVALYRLKAAPPTVPAPTTPTFFAHMKDAHACAKVPAAAGAFKKGDWVAVLGGAGGVTGSVSNSYGAATGANNPSSILGTPIVDGLQRCGMQHNIGTSRGSGAIWSEVQGNIARVKMVVVAGTRQGSYSCDHCPSSHGAVRLDVASTHPAILGKEFRLQGNAAGIANTGGVLAFGIRRGNVPVLGFGRLCVLGIAGFAPFGAGAVSSTGVGTEVSLGTIPASTPVGLTLAFQLALATTMPSIPLSNGLEIKTGL